MTADRFRIVRRNQIVDSGLPPAVQGIIYLTLGMFTAMAAWGAAAGLGMTVLLNPTTQLLVYSGGQYWPQVVHQGEWWRCITYMFSHGGLIHLGFNMFVLYQVGPMLERELGWKAFLFLYIFTGLTGTLAGLFWHPGTPVVGASGAIFGLFGFAIALYHRIGDSLAEARRNFLLQWAFYALIFGFVVGADNAGHMGGLVGGGILGFLIPTGHRMMSRLQPAFSILGWLSLTAIVLAHLSLIGSWFLR